MTAGDRGRPVRPVGESLRRLADELGLGDVHATAGVISHWEDAVGADVAAHARPVKLRDGVLTVEADDPAWGSQLRYLGGELAARLNAALGGQPVHEVRVVVARSGGSGREGRKSSRG